MIINNLMGSTNLDPELTKEMVENGNIPKNFDPLKVSEKILSDMDRLHLDTLKEYVEAMTEEEKKEIASVIPAHILLESLSKEFDRLSKLERRTMDLFGVRKED